MLSVGIDIGSRTIGLAVLEEGRLIREELRDTGFTPLETVKEMLLPLPPARITATGYGRHAAGAEFAHGIITEIKAHALGAVHCCPGVKTILDIGGQDTKVILLDHRGSVTDFQMNDKCSAGTGKFLEVMATALGYESLEEFGRESLLGNQGVKISSMCTVFAESEAISLLHSGRPRRDIGLALHLSVAEKAYGMLQRVHHQKPVAFTGGVAKNPCVVALLEGLLKEKLIMPQNPQMAGALGAALAGCQSPEPVTST